MKTEFIKYQLSLGPKAGTRYIVAENRLGVFLFLKGQLGKFLDGGEEFVHCPDERMTELLKSEMEIYLPGGWQWHLEGK